MDEKAALREAFYECIKRIEKEKENLSQRICQLSHEKSMSNVLLQEVARLTEHTNEFNTLVHVAASCADSKHVREPIAMFLKQCGAYLEIKDISNFTNAQTTKLFADLKSQPRNVQYLLSLPWVDTYKLLLPINAGWFCIRQFSTKELEQALNNKVRETFFPWAALKEEKLALSQECWLVVNDEEEPDGFGSWNLDFSDLKGLVAYTHLPTKLELALGSIMLLNWEPYHPVDKTNIWWPGFPLGTLITLYDNQFISPKPLQRGITAYEFIEEERVTCCYQYRCSELDNLSDVVGMLEDVSRSKEHAILAEHVLRYLVKAAIRDTSGPGKVDQYIDHMLCIEALLNDGPDSIKRIGQRLGVLYSLKRKRMEQVAAYFSKEIYRLRCALLHGGKKTSMDEKLSWNVRNLARKALYQTLFLLHHYNKEGIELNLSEFNRILDLLFAGREPAELGAVMQKWPGT